MSRSALMPVFDGHNDVLLRLMRGKAEPERAFLEGDNIGHLDWPRMKEGGFVGGFFAVYVPSESTGRRCGRPDGAAGIRRATAAAAGASDEPAGHAAHGRPAPPHRARLRTAR